MGSIYTMHVASSLTDWREINSSFDAATLRICYTDKNRNNSFISKEDIERNIGTIFNCPVVANYNVEDDTIGGHDVSVKRTANGVRLVNMTEPLGVVPESARVWFAEHEDDNGVTHDYLHTDVLVWKRQAVYDKLKRDGSESHSMEITVKNGEVIDGVLHIHDFEFTAFCLLGEGIEPCFESSALEMFSMDSFKREMAEMMQELKEYGVSQNEIYSSNEGGYKSDNDMEGGEEVLEEKIELANKYGIDVNALDFSIEEMSVEELTEKFEAIKAEQEYALTSNIVSEICRNLESMKVTTEYGERPAFWYVDCDFEACEVYCWDTTDWLLYGFKYELDGDSVKIDFACKTRKKYVICDFEEGDSQVSPFADAFAMAEGEIANLMEKNSAAATQLAQMSENYSAQVAAVSAFESEVEELRKFKADVEEAQKRAICDAVFEKFAFLNGIEAFEALKNSHEGMDAEAIEEKCFAIKGRNDVAAFASNQTFANVGAPKLPVERNDASASEPYGGVFVKYAKK